MSPPHCHWLANRPKACRGERSNVTVPIQEKKPSNPRPILRQRKKNKNMNNVLPKLLLSQDFFPVVSCSHISQLSGLVECWRESWRVRSLSSLVGANLGRESNEPQGNKKKRRVHQTRIMNKGEHSGGRRSKGATTTATAKPGGTKNKCEAAKRSVEINIVIIMMSGRRMEWLVAV